MEKIFTKPQRGRIVAIPFEVGQVSTLKQPVISKQIETPRVAIPFEVGQVSTKHKEVGYERQGECSRNPF